MAVDWAWGLGIEDCRLGDKLLHDLEIDLLHVDLLVKLWRKFGGLQDLLIYCCRHGDGLTAADNDVDVDVAGYC